MAKPSKGDLEKKLNKLNTYKKSLDEDGKIKEKKAISMLLSAVRQVWMRSPAKLFVLESARLVDEDPNSRRKWVFKCEKCEEFFKEADVEIDHKKGNHSFTKIDDFKNYWDNILLAPVKDLQVLCKKCHSIKTYQESRDLSWEDAVVEKAVLLKIKELKTAAKVKEFIKSCGVEPAKRSEDRKDQIRKIIKEESVED